MGKQATAKSSKPAAAKKAAAKSTTKRQGSPKPKAKAKSTPSRTTPNRQQTLTFKAAEAVQQPNEEMHALVAINSVQSESNRTEPSMETTASTCYNAADAKRIPAEGGETDRRASAHFKTLDAKTQKERLKVLITNMNNIEKRKRKTVRHDDNDYDVFCSEEFRSICYDEHGTSDTFRIKFHLFLQ